MDTHAYVYGDQVRVNAGFFAGMLGHVIYDKGPSVPKNLVVRFVDVIGQPQSLDEVFGPDEVTFISAKA
jgi:hypothetical protein